jgi:hypothetical protein
MIGRQTDEQEANMPIVAMVDNPHVSQEIYDKVREELGLDRPAGGIFHAAGPSPTGGWRVIELWESEDEARQFFQERLRPALQAAGATGPPPQPQFWPVHNYMK